MKIMLSSRDQEFCNRVRQAFARDGAVVRVADRTEIWATNATDDDGMLLHARNTASAARWCRVARRARQVGPLIACCDVVEPMGVAAVLDAGADDVVATSVTGNELLARVRAIFRRTRVFGQGQSKCGPITLDSPAREASVGGTPVQLRRAEFRLLSYLMANSNRVVGARELMEDVLGVTPSGDTTLIRVHLSQLRRKLDAVGTGRVIETVRGCGYRLNMSHVEPALKSA